MEEISKIGEINSINNLLDFKLSIKTIIFLVFAWGFACLIIIIFMLGGVNNTFDYVTTMLKSTKNTIIDIKNKSNSDVQPADKNADKNTDKNND
jgi:hypothetical protein